MHEGVGRIFRSTEAFRRAIDIAGHSPFSGMLFCVGTWAEMSGPDGNARTSRRPFANSARADWPKECKLLHEVYAASLEYAVWLERDIPIAYGVPEQPGPVTSGLRLGDRLLMRRTDFGCADPAPVTIDVDGTYVEVAVRERACQVLPL